MSVAQITMISALWGIALVPLGMAAAIFVLTKIGALRTPLPDHYPGRAIRIVSLLTVGGYTGLHTTAWFLGAGAAVAGICYGFTGTTYWLLVIILAAPAVGVITATGMIFCFGWPRWPGSGTSST